ncbi:MAG: CDP-alcohol phosphatidyltransferase family protein [Solirubrobacterales bacterium]
MPQRLSRRRLLGLDRSGPEPTQTRAGQPLRPFTIPNLICYVRLAAIPVFCAIAFDSGDGRDALASLIFLAIALGDLLDGFVARATGQYSRLGALLDPVVDRLTILAGAAVCWHFGCLAGRSRCSRCAKVTTLALSYYGLKHGADIEITWVGRIAVFLIMGGIFWSMVLDWTIIRIGFSVGVILSIVATVLYVREARRHVQTSVQPSRSD